MPQIAGFHVTLSYSRLKKVTHAVRNVKGIGIHQAFVMASSGCDMLEALASKGADAEYQENFNKAMTVFQHQTVFDLESCCTVPLTKWDTAPPMDMQNLCGKYP